LKPAATIRMRRSVNTDTPLQIETPLGQNPPDGAVIDYALAEGEGGPVTIEILTAAGELVRRFSSADAPPPIDRTTQFPAYWLSAARVPTAHVGMNRFVWDLRYRSPPARHPDYTIAALPGDTPALPLGPQVLPGTYQLKLTTGGKVFTQPLVVKMDPRVKTTATDLSRLFTLERQIARAIEESARALDALDTPGGSNTGSDQKKTALTRLHDALSDLLAVVDTADVAPTRHATAAFTEFKRQLDAQLRDAAGR
jgi:hypothetical protein